MPVLGTGYSQVQALPCQLPVVPSSPGAQPLFSVVQGEGGEGRRLGVSPNPALGQAIPDLQPSGWTKEGLPCLPPTAGVLRLRKCGYETSLEVLRQHLPGAYVSTAARRRRMAGKCGWAGRASEMPASLPGHLLWLPWAWLLLPLPGYSSRGPLMLHSSS